jgi:vancomycin permeability regulator SanA
MFLILLAVTVCYANQLRFASVLGAQVFDKDRDTLADHTKMRVVAAQVLYEQGLATSLLLSGGSNVGVRYWMNGTLMKDADFRFVTFANARTGGPSESRAMVTISPTC